MPTGHANRLLPTLRRVVLVSEAVDRTDGQLLTAFVREGDGDAFAALVRRHGPMVLGTCRRVVGNADAADDVFQAVFLVLARRAASVRSREQVGNWLYGVAFRTAMKVRAGLARRRSREKQVAVMPEPVAPITDPWVDLQPVIDEELARLPDKLRQPVVLCDLEGRPQRAVAKQLGVAPATLATRLASARRLLATRLSRRGVSLSGGALAVVLGERASAGVVAPKLVGATARAAEAVAAGCGASGLTGLVSVHAIQLCEGVLRMMMLSKLKSMGAAVLVALALTGGLGFGLMPAQADDAPAPAKQAKPKPRLQEVHKTSEPIDDATFLRRLCLDLTDALPSRIEMGYFLDDRDANKRAKVVEWMASDDVLKAYLAKKLGVPVEQIQVIHAVDARTGRGYQVAIVRPSKGEVRLTSMTAFAFSPDGKRLVASDEAPFEVSGLAFSPDGKTLAVDTVPVRDRTVQLWTVIRRQPSSTIVNSSTGVTGRIVLNERNFDVRNAPQLPISGFWFSVIGEGQLQPLSLDFGEPIAGGELLTQIGLDDESFYPPAAGLLARARTTFAPDSDEDFLRRVIRSARGGGAPTALEEKYFTADADPRKREKLLDLLLKDPAVAKQLGDDWKKKMLEAPPVTATLRGAQLRYSTTMLDPKDEALLFYHVAPHGGVRNLVPLAEPVALKPDRFDRLVSELIAAKKTDEQLLEAVTLTTVGRLPTAEERRATLAVIGTSRDRPAAWVALARAYAASEEGKKNASTSMTLPGPK